MLLECSRHPDARALKLVGNIVLGLIKNPILLAIICGLSLSRLGLSLTGALDTGVDYCDTGIKYRATGFRVLHLQPGIFALAALDIRRGAVGRVAHWGERLPVHRALQLRAGACACDHYSIFIHRVFTVGITSAVVPPRSRLVLTTDIPAISSLVGPTWARLLSGVCAAESVITTNPGIPQDIDVFQLA